MKVYAVTEGCEDYFYPDYTIVDKCVYLKEEDARKRINELIEKNQDLDSELSILCFEVKE